MTSLFPCNYKNYRFHRQTIYHKNCLSQSSVKSVASIQVVQGLITTVVLLSHMINSTCKERDHLSKK